MAADFEEYFSKNFLVSTFDDRVSHAKSKGIDGVSPRLFSPIKESILDSASRKSISGCYKFTRYKLKLISKGPDKAPRKISIPTVRDRVVLRALCDYLSDYFSSDLEVDIPQNIIAKVKSDIESRVFTSFVKLDVQDFYPSIDHEILSGILRKCGVDDRAIRLVEGAISTSWYSDDWGGAPEEAVGVPQGLSISNILASIYMMSVDKVAKGFFNAKYYRYVDDILILSRISYVRPILDRMESQFSDLSLKFHEINGGSGKSAAGRIVDKQFGYLGYHFKGNLITVRPGSIKKIRDSLINIFVAHHRSKIKNEHFLQWRINLRITGCIFDDRCKGWLFFFSEINDIPLLYELDAFVAYLAKRFSVKVEFKRFVRAYYEARYVRHSGQYVPDFDNYPISEMRRVMIVCWKKDVSGLSDDEVSIYFKKRLANEVRDLETDIRDIRY